MTPDELGPTMETDAVRVHLRRLAAAGISPAAVATLLALPNVSGNYLRAVRRGDVERIAYRTGAAVLAIKVPDDDRDVSWTDDAECRRPYVASVARSFGLARSVDLFFSGPGVGHRTDPARDAALAICGACRVKDECLAYALAAPPHFAESGIWGGTTDDDRHKLRKGRK